MCITYRYNIFLLIAFTEMAEIVSVFGSIITNEGNTTTVLCEAIGYPPPTIIWSSSNEDLSDGVSVSDSVSVPTGYGNVTRVSVYLILTTALREDTGDYICSANNSIGSDDQNVSITIQCKLRICNFHIIIIN